MRDNDRASTSMTQCTGNTSRQR